MAKYQAKLKDKDVTVVTLAGKEYKAKDGVIEVDDAHHDAHRDAATMGLAHATEKAEPEKQPVPPVPPVKTGDKK